MSGPRSHPSIRPIPTDRPTLYAFQIDGEVSADEMEAMGDRMNAAFDAHDSVDMLLIFDHFDGSEVGAGLDWSSVRSRFRSLTNVDKYVVVGAPDGASALIDMMDKVIPVKARTFPIEELDAAWAFLGAKPRPSSADPGPAT